MDDSNAQEIPKRPQWGPGWAWFCSPCSPNQTEDLYGYEIAKRLAIANEGTSIFKEGTIYPVLRALSAGNLLTSRIVPSYSGPPRRYYRITEQGRSVLAEWTAIWVGTRGFVDRFIETEHRKDTRHEPQRASLHRSIPSATCAKSSRARMPRSFKTPCTTRKNICARKSRRIRTNPSPTCSN